MIITTMSVELSCLVTLAPLADKIWRLRRCKRGPWMAPDYLALAIIFPDLEKLIILL